MSTTRQRLLELLAGRNEYLELDEASLELAALEYPDLDRQEPLRLLDEWAAELASRLKPAAGGAEYVAQANRLLFDELGFRGDDEDYYHPRNSCLNVVLERRRGLPIALSLVYMEVGRRLLRPVYGIGLPAHFVARYNDGLISVYIDAFHGGELLDEEQCLELARQATGRPLRRTPLLFAAVTKRELMTRMANNLRAAYQRLGRPDGVEAVEDLLAGAAALAGLPGESTAVS